MGWFLITAEGLLSKDGPRLTPYVSGKLKFTAIAARNLPDTDDTDKADPYMKVTIAKHNGQTVTKTTSTKDSELNPQWNEELDFGEGDWVSGTFRIWDKDGGWRGADDRMSPVYAFHIVVPCSDVEKTNDGKVDYSYYVDYSL